MCIVAVIADVHVWDHLWLLKDGYDLVDPCTCTARLGVPSLPLLGDLLLNFSGPLTTRHCHTRLVRKEHIMPMRRKQRAMESQATVCAGVPMRIAGRRVVNGRGDVYKTFSLSIEPPYTNTL